MLHFPCHRAGTGDFGSSLSVPQAGGLPEGWTVLRAPATEASVLPVSGAPGGHDAQTQPLLMAARAAALSQGGSQLAHRWGWGGGLVAGNRPWGAAISGYFARCSLLG